MCSFFHSLFTVTTDNNVMCSKRRIGNRNHCFFQINSLSLIESEEFIATSILWHFNLQNLPESISDTNKIPLFLLLFVKANTVACFKYS